MKNIMLIISLFSICSSGIWAQFRVTDRSERRQPSWVNSLQKDYIIMAAEGTSIQEAQQNALMLIKERIVSSVADNVKAESQLVTEEVNYNNNVSVFLEKFSATITTESGNVPYLQGVSLSRAEGYYWEEQQDRSSGRTKYTYHVKYPFSEFELKKLVVEFQLMQRKLEEQLEQLLSAVGTVTSVEQINSNMAELRTLSDAFIDGRKQRALTGVTRYQELLNSISIQQVKSSLGEVIFALRSGDREFATAQRPNAQSDCARVTGIRQQGSHWLVSYNSDYCYDDPENHLEVVFRIGNTPARNKFYFNVKEGAVEISLRDPIVFNLLDSSEETATQSQITLVINSRYSAPFIVESLTFNFQGIPPITMREINQRFEGAGNHHLTLDILTPIDMAKTSSSSQVISRISGNLHYREADTNQQKTLRILNHPYSTTW